MYDRILNFFTESPKTQTDNEPKEIKMPYLNHSFKCNIYLGGGKEFIHATFDNEQDAKDASKLLEDLNLVKNAPKVNTWNASKYKYSTKQYDDGTIFFRIHRDSYPTIAIEFNLPELESLEVYSAHEDTGPNQSITP